SEWAAKWDRAKVSSLRPKLPRASLLYSRSVPLTKLVPVNACSFLTLVPESSTSTAIKTSKQSPSCPLTHEDRDPFGESFCGLGIETSSEFECICAQSFSAFTDQLFELCEFIAE